MKITATVILLLLLNICHAQPPLAETKYFSFNGNYLVNLHHYLYQKGLQYAGAKTEEEKNFENIVGLTSNVVFNDAEKEDVMKGILWYAENAASKNLLFDEELTAVKYALEKAASIEEAEAAGVKAGYIKALHDADGFFRVHAWPNITKANQDFIDNSVADVTSLEEEVLKNCAKFYKFRSKKDEKYRVDLVDYATFFGAYTTTSPYVSAVISSTDERHKKSQAVEVVFHEATHAMTDSLIKMQRRLSNEMSIKFDNNIWHAIQFYITGEVVKSEYAKSGNIHELYMDANNLADINPAMKKLIPAVKKNWKPYLEGKASMETAFRGLMTEIK